MYLIEISDISKRDPARVDNGRKGRILFEIKIQGTYPSGESLLCDPWSEWRLWRGGSRKKGEDNKRDGQRKKKKGRLRSIDLSMYRNTRVRWRLGEGLGLRKSVGSPTTILVVVVKVSYRNLRIAEISDFRYIVLLYRLRFALGPLVILVV